MRYPIVPHHRHPHREGGSVARAAQDAADDRLAGLHSSGMAGVVDHPPSWNAGHGLRRVDEPVALGIAENHREPEGLVPADAPRQFGEARLVDLAVEKRRGREGAQDVDLRRELAFQKNRDALHMIARFVLDRLLLVAQPGEAEGRRQHHKRQQGRDHEQEQRATAVDGRPPNRTKSTLIRCFRPGAPAATRRPRDTGSTDRPRRPQTNLGRARPYPAGSTKLSSTIFRPALSKSTVSLLPSMAAIVPGPNFWWKTRWPAAKPDSAPVDLATSSPSIRRGPRP